MGYLSNLYGFMVRLLAISRGTFQNLWNYGIILRHSTEVWVSLQEIFWGYRYRSGENLAKVSAFLEFNSRYFH